MSSPRMGSACERPSFHSSNGPSTSKKPVQRTSSPSRSAEHHVRGPGQFLFRPLLAVHFLPEYGLENPGLLEQGPLLDLRPVLEDRQALYGTPRVPQGLEDLQLRFADEFGIGELQHGEVEQPGLRREPKL